MAVDKVSEVRKRLQSCEYFTEVKEVMVLARLWYVSGEIDHDDYQKLIQESKHHEDRVFPGR